MKNSSKSLKPMLARARVSRAYATEGVKLEFTEQIVARMDAAGLSKSALAARLKVAPAYITKVLQGRTNFTLESMVKMTRALGTELHVRLEPVKSGRGIRTEPNGKAMRSSNGAPRRNRARDQAARANVF